MSSGYRQQLATLIVWPARRWLAAASGAAVFAIAAGAPTDVIPNPLFDRMTPVQWWSYPILAATALLGGLVMATYVRSPAQPSSLTETAGGGVLSALAIGCPVCNKLVVLLLGAAVEGAWLDEGQRDPKDGDDDPGELAAGQALTGDAAGQPHAPQRHGRQHQRPTGGLGPAQAGVERDREQGKQHRAEQNQQR